MGMTVLGDRKRVMMAIKKVMGNSSGSLTHGASYGELSEMLESSFEDKSPRGSFQPSPVRISFLACAVVLKCGRAESVAAQYAQQ